jgi:3-deoxy-7-phosphoheptulonate synthase
LKDHSHLPVIVDPSHGVGVAKYVPAMSCAALVAGADGLLIEVHPDPRRAMSDAAQTLDTKTFAELMESLRRLGPFSKRSICEQAIAV